MEPPRRLELRTYDLRNRVELRQWRTAAAQAPENQLDRLRSIQTAIRELTAEADALLADLAGVEAHDAAAE